MAINRTPLYPALCLNRTYEKKKPRVALNLLLQLDLEKNIDSIKTCSPFLLFSLSIVTYYYTTVREKGGENSRAKLSL